MEQTLAGLQAEYGAAQERLAQATVDESKRRQGRARCSLATCAQYGTGCAGAVLPVARLYDRGGRVTTVNGESFICGPGGDLTSSIQADSRVSVNEKPQPALPL